MFWFISLSFLFVWLPLKFLYKLIYLIFYFANNLATLFRNSLFLMYFLCFFFYFAYYITCDILSCFRTFFFETKHISFHYVMLKDIINFLSNIVSFKVKLRTDINKKTNNYKTKIIKIHSNYNLLNSNHSTFKGL